MSPHRRHGLATHAVQPVSWWHLRGALQHLAHQLGRRAFGLHLRSQPANVRHQPCGCLLQLLAVFVWQGAGSLRGASQMGRPAQRAGRIPGGSREEIRMVLPQTAAQDCDDLLVVVSDAPAIDLEGMTVLAGGLYEELLRHGEVPRRGSGACFSL